MNAERSARARRSALPGARAAEHARGAGHEVPRRRTWTIMSSTSPPCLAAAACARHATKGLSTAVLRLISGPELCIGGFGMTARPSNAQACRKTFGDSSFRPLPCTPGCSCPCAKSPPNQSEVQKLVGHAVAAVLPCSVTTRSAPARPLARLVRAEAPPQEHRQARKRGGARGRRARARVLAQQARQRKQAAPEHLAPGARERRRLPATPRARTPKLPCLACFPDLALRSACPAAHFGCTMHCMAHA